MYWVALVISAGFFLLLVLAKKEKPPSGVSHLLRPFYKMALYLYKKLCHRLPGLFSSPQVERDLIGLHPGETRENLKAEYYGKKAAICLVILLAGTLFGAAAKYSAESGIALREDGAIVRGSYQEGAKEIELETDYGHGQTAFQVAVEPRLLSEEESEKMFEDFLEQLPAYILGTNADFQDVTSNLNLQERYGDFPIKVRWESSNPGILSDGGQMFSVEEPQQVTLSFWMTYGAYEQEGEFSLTLRPRELAEEEALYLEIEELLEQSQVESISEEEWRLPEQWRGQDIRWRQAVEDDSLLLWMAAVATAVAVFLFLDKDLHDQVEKRKKILHREYPEIVHQLALFVGAGMTVRGAFQKIAGDYEAKQEEDGRRLPAYEEMLYTCRELRSGISEGLSYEHFGKRTGLQEYIRLSALLTQNLKRGNSALLERLREEAEKASQERLQQGRKLGEEAGTKLLVPMVLMLAVVMAMIMIPAFSNM